MDTIDLRNLVKDCGSEPTRHKGCQTGRLRCKATIRACRCRSSGISRISVRRAWRENATW